MYCVPEKQVRLLEAIIDFHERAHTCIELGAPMTKISETGLKEILSRLKSSVKNDSLNEFDIFEEKMRSIMDELERTYRSKMNTTVRHR
jgi:V/A-type H+-transporting ATPase subunit A